MSDIDPKLRTEILEPIMGAIRNLEVHVDARFEETDALVHKCIADQVEIRGELTELRTRVEELEAARASHANRLSGHERTIGEVRAESRRLASDTRHEVEEMLVGFEAHVEGFADAIAAVKKTGEETAADVGELKTNLERAVFRVLAKHVQRIEAAADRLTKSPQAKTAASIGGAFAGSAAVTAAFELLKHFF